MRQFFGRKGLLSEWHPGYEFRAGQLADGGGGGVRAGRKEAPDGRGGHGHGENTGLFGPAILSGKRIVISTGTKNLQEQLFFKDIPFLEQHLGPLRACYMKGRGNYACRQKIYDAENEPILEGLEEVADFRMIREWEKTTETGDRAEIKTLPESSTVWAKIDARSEACTGQKCPQFERCFITKMHQGAQASDIIIVNHHLLFADLAVKGGRWAKAGGIIPDYGAVIFDEAHEIEDVAGQYFGVNGFQLSVRGVGARRSWRWRRKDFGSKELDRTLTIAGGSRRAVLRRCSGLVKGARHFVAGNVLMKHEGAVSRHAGARSRSSRCNWRWCIAAPAETMPLIHRAREMERRLKFWMEIRRKDVRYWIERRGRGTFLQATPIEVAQLLDENCSMRLIPPC